MKRNGLILAFAIVGLVGTVTSFAGQAQPTRGIANVTGNLYRAQNNTHFTVFLVTAEGIIVSDPISRDFATWLKAELAERFGLPVRYVLYSHSDADHGGRSFRGHGGVRGAREHARRASGLGPSPHRVLLRQVPRDTWRKERGDDLSRSRPLGQHVDSALS